MKNLVLVLAWEQNICVKYYFATTSTRFARSSCNLLLAVPNRRVAVEFCHTDLDNFKQCYTIPLFHNVFEA